MIRRWLWLLRPSVRAEVARAVEYEQAVARLQAVLPREHWSEAELEVTRRSRYLDSRAAYKSLTLDVCEGNWP